MEILNNLYIRIILSSAIIYLFIILCLRIFGRKELAQLSVFDLVFILLISNAVQNAMVDAKLSSLLYGLVAAITLFVVNFILKKLEFKFPSFGKILQGEAIMLVYDGKAIESHMRVAQFTHEELMEAIREHGVASIREVDLAILEVDGNVSIITHDFSKKSQRRRKAHKIIAKQN